MAVAGKISRSRARVVQRNSESRQAATAGTYGKVTARCCAWVCGFVRLQRTFQGARMCRSVISQLATGSCVERSRTSIRCSSVHDRMAVLAIAESIGSTGLEPRIWYVEALSVLARRQLESVFPVQQSNMGTSARTCAIATFLRAYMPSASHARRAGCCEEAWSTHEPYGASKPVCRCVP